MYLLIAVFISILIVRLFRNHSRVITWVSIVFFCFFLLKEAVWCALTLDAAIKLDHPKPGEYIFYAACEIITFIVVVALVIIFRKKINITAEIMREGSM